MIASRIARLSAVLALATACADDPAPTERGETEDEAASPRDASRKDGGKSDASPFKSGADASPARAGDASARSVDARGDEPSQPDGSVKTTADAASGGDAASCSAAQMACDGTCIDPKSDERHCGDCRKRCESGEQCVHGACQTEQCSDDCARMGGVEWACKTRFMYGVNYAWHHFGSDFGGNEAWSQPGVSANPKVEQELELLANNGVSVVRWWMFPDFRGDGVTFDGSDAPSGTGGTLMADVERALELAEDYDLYLMLTLFSFDNFRPTKTADGIKSRGIREMLRDAGKRRALLDKVVRPVVKAAAASRNEKRVIAWDVINEPEWAITGPSLYGGDPPFDPNPELEAVSHMEMESFVREVIAVLREESEAMVSVGGTAMKWKSAWSKVDVDFHQFHIYDWVNMYWPYNRSPKEYGVDDKPVVMGEFPAKGLSMVDYQTLLGSWYDGGYQGALAWAFTDPMFGGADILPDVKRFADQHPCDTQY